MRMVHIADGSPGLQVWGLPAPWPTTPVQGHVHGSAWGCTDPPVVLGVMRVRNGSARAIVSLLPPCQALGAGRALPGLGRQRWHTGLLLGMWFLLILTPYSPTTWVCGAGGPASCPAAPEHLGFIPMCICTRSQRVRCRGHCAGCAVPRQWEWGMAPGAGEGLGYGELGFESVEGRRLMERCFPRRKSKFGSTNPDCKLAERARQENQQHQAARRRLSRG